MADSRVIRQLLARARAQGASPKELTAQQRQILSLIETEARRRGLPAHGRRIKSAIETGLVESNLRNLPGGDADSAGWRQERASLYPDPTNTRASVKRYFDEAGKLDTGHGSAGQLAARVQRPAAQYRGRYDKASPIANALMKNQQGLPMQRGARAATNVPDGRGQLIANYLMSDSKDAANTLALGIAGLQGQKAPGVRNTSSGATPSGSGGHTGGNYPTGSRGKIIGTPYAGTHTLGNWQSDNAVDIAVPVGTPMIARDGGVVVKVTRHPQGVGRFAGDQITIRGAGGNSYFYAHGVAHVKAGQRVSKGQRIGTTGSANGVAHLHFGQEHGDPSKTL